MVAYWVLLMVLTALLLLLVPLYNPHHEFAEVRGGNSLPEQITLVVHMSVLFGTATFIFNITFLVRTALGAAYISYWVLSLPESLRQRVWMVTASAIVVVATLFAGILEEAKTPSWDNLWYQLVPASVFTVVLTPLLSGWLAQRIPVRRGNVSIEGVLSKMFILYGSVFAGIVLMYGANICLFLHRSLQEDAARVTVANPLELWKQSMYAFPSQWWIIPAMVAAVVTPASLSSILYPWSERVDARCTSVVVSAIIVANWAFSHLWGGFHDAPLRTALVSLALVVLSVLLSGVLAGYLYRLRKHWETIRSGEGESNSLRREDGHGCP
jgi:hypothetical protein